MEEEGNERRKEKLAWFCFKVSAAGLGAVGCLGGGHWTRQLAPNTFALWFSVCKEKYSSWLSRGEAINHMSRNDYPCLKGSFGPFHFFKRSGGSASDAERRWGVEMLLPLQRCLHGKKGGCPQKTPSQAGAPTSPPSEEAETSDRPPKHIKAGWCPSGYNWSQLTYLCNCGNLWQVALLKLMSLLQGGCSPAPHSGCLCGRYQLWGYSREIHLHPVLSMETRHTRLGAMYLDWSICFILVWKKKTMPIGVDTCFASQQSQQLGR